MELTIKKTVEETVAIDLPVFFKNNDGYLIAGINEETGIYITNRSGLKQYSIGDLWLYKSNLSEAVNSNGSWEKITEQEFMEAHEAFINSLSLTPQLKETL